MAAIASVLGGCTLLFDTNATVDAATPKDANPGTLIIGSVSPDRVLWNSTPTAVTIVGSGFDNTTRVTVGDQAAQVDSFTPTELNVTVASSARFGATPLVLTKSNAASATRDPGIYFYTTEVKIALSSSNLIVSNSNADQIVSTMAAGDLDGMGWDDLVAASNGGTVVKFLLGEVNTATEELLGPDDGDHRSLDIGDIDNDGDQDIVLGSLCCSSNIRIFKNDDGIFSVSTVDAPNGVVFARIFDNDGDGNGELVTIHGSGVAEDRIRVFDSGQPPSQTDVFPIVTADLDAGLLSEPWIFYDGHDNQALLADLNSDGRDDLVSTVFEHDGVAVKGGVVAFMGTASGSFDFANPHVWTPDDTAPSEGMKALEVGDINEDGNLDLLSARFGSTNEVWPLLGNGAGEFTLGQAVTTPYFDPSVLATGDFNGDGYLDFWVGQEAQDDLHLYLGIGGGEFAYSPASTINLASLPEVPNDTTTGPTDLLAHDFDGDGILDLAVGTRSSTATGDSHTLLAIVLRNTSADR